jgi:hypothetical protein
METFVVRIWAPSTGPTEAVTEFGVRGNVEHVRSGHAGVFNSFDQLNRMIVDELSRPAVGITRLRGPESAVDTDESSAGSPGPDRIHTDGGPVADGT